MNRANPRPFHQESYTVRTREVDAAGRLKLSAFADYFQEAAAHHTTALRIGPYQLKEHRLAWVLSRLRIDLERYPGWGERLTVKTWPKGDPAVLAAPRDFLLLDADGATVARATSLWLLLDIDAMRPRPLTALPVTFPVDDTLPPAIPEPPGKVAAPPEPTPLHRRSPEPSDIDLNGHLNNACYLDWIADCLDPDRPPPRRIEINYLAEIKLGDTIVLASGAGPRGPVIQGVNATSGQAAFRARSD